MESLRARLVASLETGALAPPLGDDMYMEAIRLHSPGPEGLRVEELEAPQLGPCAPPASSAA